jgi:5,5'-dehydrodivanillate O-demethylase oxygenase subunit
VLPESQNKLLTSVGPGTAMGDLLRRYWWPIAGVSEFESSPVKAVRLLGEDLVLYKDLSGTYGMVDRHCPHRRADLSYGFVEQCGLRCNYHGWLYDETGQCIEQPYEDTAHGDVNLKAKIRMTAYPVEAKAGLLWAYLGPQPAPLLPDWEFFNFKQGFRQIVISDVPCNWLQCQENSIDPVHFEWMHSNWSVRLNNETGPYTATHIKVDFTEFDYGFQYKRIKADTNELDPLWTTGRVCLWPNALYTGDHIEYRVPVDDENTLSVGWFYDRVPRESEPYHQDDDKIPTWHGPIKDDKTGRWITSHVMNQDFIAWVGQGTIADRSKEHLGASDRGVAAIRRRFLADIEAIKEGKDPKGVIRDPAINHNVEVPIAFRKALQEGKSINDKDLRKRFVFQAGQPDAVKAAFEAAMGFVSETPVTADHREFEKAAFGR